MGRRIGDGFWNGSYELIYFLLSKGADRASLEDNSMSHDPSSRDRERIGALIGTWKTPITAEKDDDSAVVKLLLDTYLGPKPIL